MNNFRYFHCIRIDQSNHVLSWIIPGLMRAISAEALGTRLFVKWKHHVDSFWRHILIRHVLKGETSKRNDRNETTETTETNETTETKRPKRNDRNETTETKRPKRNDRNETTETKRPKRNDRNGRKYKLQEKWKILKYEIYWKFCGSTGL